MSDVEASSEGEAVADQASNRDLVEDLAAMEALAVGLTSGPGPSQGPSSTVPKVRAPGSGVFQNIESGILHIGGDFNQDSPDKLAGGLCIHPGDDCRYRELGEWPASEWPVCKRCNSAWIRQGRS